MTDHGFICGECNGEVSAIWEQITVRGGQGAYECDDCGKTGEWRMYLNDDGDTGLSGCLVRRGEYDGN